MRRECWERFSRHRGLAIPTCIKARASRTCRDACRDGLLAVSFEAGVAENVPGILGACAIHRFTIRQESHENTYELSLICFFFRLPAVHLCADRSWELHLRWGHCPHGVRGPHSLTARGSGRGGRQRIGQRPRRPGIFQRSVQRSPRITFLSRGVPGLIKSHLVQKRLKDQFIPGAL